MTPPPSHPKYLLGLLWKSISPDFMEHHVKHPASDISGRGAISSIIEMPSRLFQQYPEELSRHFHTLCCAGQGSLGDRQCPWICRCSGALSAVLINMQGATPALEFFPFTTFPCWPLQEKHWHRHSLGVPGGCAGPCWSRL